MKRIFILLFLLPLTVLAVPDKQKRLQEEKAFQEIYKLVSSQHFQIDIDKVYTQDGFDVSRFTPKGKITFTDTLVEGFLPYFGKAYSLPYGEGGGIKLANQPKKIDIKTIQKRKQQSIQVNFSIRNIKDTYQISIEVTPNGTCSIHLHCNHLAPIAYSGLISPIEQAEKQESQQSNLPITDFSQIKQLADSNHLHMIFTIASTHHTNYLQPNTPYTDQNIRIEKDSAFVIIQDSIATGYLPYYSSGIQSNQTQKKEIIFFNKMLHLKKETLGEGKRQSITYQFEVVAPTDTYKINIDIRPQGQCYMFINSLHKTPINYIGQIVKEIF